MSYIFIYIKNLRILNKFLCLKEMVPWFQSNTNANAKAPNYTAILRKGDSEPVIHDFYAKSDAAAINIMNEHLKGSRVLYVNKIGLAHGWKVSALTQIGDDINLWKETNSQSGGSSKKLTKQKVSVGKKIKCVYVGPKGGRYVKGANGKFISI
jgi:hypothetical protein